MQQGPNGMQVLNTGLSACLEPLLREKPLGAVFVLSDPTILQL